MTYKVAKLSKPVHLDARWDKEPWNGITPLLIGRYMGTKPEHFPKTQARIAYDDETVYVIFRVEDRYVRATCRNHQEAAFRDSCVEFFFTPGPDVARGYFNLEMNCGGRMLLCFQTAPGRDSVRQFTIDECNAIQVAHSMPGLVEDEITEPTTWTVEYRIPLDLLEKYCSVDRPAPGVVWRANLFKCADATSHPHWLTWSPVDFPSPRFHLPQFFGTLEFE